MRIKLSTSLLLLLVLFETLDNLVDQSSAMVAHCKPL